MELDSIAVSIRKARLYSGLTQKQVADALDKSQTSVAAWETGRSQPDAKTIVALCKLFHVSSDYLLGLAEFHNNNDKIIFDALLGTDVYSFPEETIESLSRFRHELSYLSNLLSDIDSKLLPHALNSLTSILHIYVDIGKYFVFFKKSYTVYHQAEHLYAKLNSISDTTRNKILSDQMLQEFFNEVSQFIQTSSNSPSQDFVVEIMPNVEHASEVVAKFALSLSAELDRILQITRDNSTET